MTMFVETPIIAAQAATELAGAATTAGTLTGSAPAMLTAPPMGAEEVSAMLSTAAAAHGGQFLTAAGTGAVQRALFGTAVGVAGVTYEAIGGLSKVALAL
jgi:hypothetical protein